MNPITESELKAAVKRFLSQHGSIKTLPPEEIVHSRLVGEQYGAYESMSGIRRLLGEAPDSRFNRGGTF